VLNRIKGYLPSRISHFITHLHTTPRPIYLTRHGESLFNQRDLIGGDSALSDRYVNSFNMEPEIMIAVESFMHKD